MLRVLLSLTLVLVTVRAQVDDDTYSSMVDTQVSEAVIDGSDAIARFLGFLCPKGHRCLPVLECLPCDYGTYKENEGSDLCTPCSTGCTTLRKGAESERECVPKCPPGYEESECGKTCTKCHPGYFKTNWKNVPCQVCPLNSVFDPDMVGMRRKAQCYSWGTRNVTSTPAPSTPTTEEEDPTPVTSDGCNIGESCTREEHDIVRLKLLFGTACKSFCQCSPYTTNVDGTTEYYWEVQDCSPGTLWSSTIGVCDHADNVECNDGIPPTTTPRVSTNQTDDPISSDGCIVEESCTREEHDIDRLKLLFGTACQSFCQCSPYTTNADGTTEYYWEVQDCAPGTLWSSTIGVCDHADTVECNDGIPPTTTPRVSTNQTDDPVSSDGCIVEESCTREEHDIDRLKLLFGTACQSFCQCSPYTTNADGTTEYYWEVQDCAPGTLWSSTIGVCDHADNVECNDGIPPTTTPRVSTNQTDDPVSSDGCIVEESCTREEHDIDRLKLLFGTACQSFCQCSPYTTNADGTTEYYWEVQDCAPGTLWSSTIGVCDHADNVECNDGIPPTTTPRVSTNQTDDPVSSDGCIVEESCTREEHDIDRLKLLFGTACQSFCQCSPYTTNADGTTEYYWEVQDCAPGTLWSSTIGVCDHADNVECNDGIPPTTTPRVSTNQTDDPVSSDVCIVEESCTREEHDIDRLKLLFGTACQSFCQCSPYTTNADGTTEYYWEVQDCAPGTLWSSTIGVCDHADNVECNDGIPPTTTPRVSTNQTDDPVSSDGCIVEESCTREEHDIDRLKLLFGTACQSFCQCSPYTTNADGTTEYYWEVQDCAPGTLWSSTIGVCDHADNVECNDGIPPTTTPRVSTNQTDDPVSSDGCIVEESCTREEHDIDRLKLLFGTACQSFCQCSPYTTNADGTTEYYWEVQDCAPGTLWSSTIGVCDHADNVECNDGIPPTTTPRVSTNQTDDPISSDGCIVGESCTREEHDIDRLMLLFGTACQSFCQCSPYTTNADGMTEYYWEVQDCAPGTLWSSTIGVCDHADNVECNDGIPPTTTPRVLTNQTDDPISSDGCIVGESCTREEHDIDRLKQLFGTACKSFCQCSPYTTNNDGTTEYYWEVLDCAPGTLWNSIIGLCDHADNVECNESTTYNQTMETMEPIVCADYLADIVIVLDGSGSVGQTDFTTQLAFIVGIIDELDSFNPARIAVVTYSDNINDVIYLNEHNRTDTLINDIMSLSYVGGETYTGSALSYVSTVVLDVNTGDRNNVQNVVFVLTDGVSTDPSDTWAQAQHLHTMSSKVFAIGIGDSIDENELHTIASDEEYVLFADSFESLNTLSNEVKAKSCADSSAGCVEGSMCSNYEYENIRYRLLFGSDCTKFCQCAPLQTFVDGPIHYYWEVHDCPTGTQWNSVYGMNATCDHSGNVQCMDGYIGQFTNPPVTMSPTPQTTDVEYTTTTSGVFTSNCGGTFSDNTGTFTSPNYPLNYDSFSECIWHINVQDGLIVELLFHDFDVEVSSQCSYDYVKIYDASIDDGNRQLGTYCGSIMPVPVYSTSNVMTVQFVADASIQLRGFIASYQATIPPTTEEPIVCGYYPADVVFVLDSSGSVGQDNFNLQLNFVASLIEYYDVSDTSTRFAAVTYGTRVNESIPLNAHDDKDNLKAAVLDLDYTGGFTYTGDALEYVVNEILTPGNGDRSYAENVVIVMTDGESTDPVDTRLAALNLHTIASKVFSIGIGQYVNETELFDIASNDSYVFFAPNYYALTTLQNEIKRDTCAGSPPRTSTPVPTTTTGSPPSTSTPVPTTTADSCGGSLTGHSGWFASRGYPNAYFSMERCVWTISVSPGYSIQLTFETFSLEIEASCAYDRVVVFDAAFEDQNAVLATYCTDYVPAPVHSTSNVMTILFESDHNVQETGFNASFVAVDMSTQASETTPITASLTPTPVPTAVATDPTTFCPQESCYNVSYYAVPGCERFCQCNVPTNSWVFQDCNVPHELFNWDFLNCDWEYNVDAQTCRTLVP